MDKKELKIAPEHVHVRQFIFDLLSEHGTIVNVRNRHILCNCDKRGLEIIKMLEHHNVLVSSPALTVGTRYF